MNESNEVVYKLQQSSNGRWGYRPNIGTRGLILADRATGESLQDDAMSEAFQYSFSAGIPDELVGVVPDGVSLSIDFLELDQSEFLEAFHDAHGAYPCATITAIVSDAGKISWVSDVDNVLMPQEN
tara:strand:+ start:205 stop:582 length:378 start_codon:yes stop_codon:yes gene_type:complete